MFSKAAVPYLPTSSVMRVLSESFYKQSPQPPQRSERGHNFSEDTYYEGWGSNPNSAFLPLGSLILAKTMGFRSSKSDGVIGREKEFMGTKPQNGDGSFQF